MKSICILALSSIPAIVCAQQDPSQEDVFQLCLQLAQRQQRLIESVHDEASGDLAAAELKALGAAVIGLYSSEPMSKLSAEQQQQLLSCVNAVVQKAQELKKLGFYGSRLMLAAYDSMKLTELPEPTEEQINKGTAYVREQYELVENQLQGITDRQSADEAALRLISIQHLAELAWSAGVLRYEFLQEMQAGRASSADNATHMKRIRQADFYGSILLKEIFRQAAE